MDLVADAVGRLGALGWLTEHNDSDADPPLVSPTAAGLAEVAVWDEAYADREARRRYAKAALFAYCDRAGQHRGGEESHPENFLWVSEAFYCGRQLPLEDLEFARNHLELPAPVHVGPAERGEGDVADRHAAAARQRAHRRRPRLPRTPPGTARVAGARRPRPPRRARHRAARRRRRR
ncbi:hypothetical protein [Streptomyces sp. NPDC051684]|uniref:hypothetical protein n=1 Tax=Streptomyces sp. NPDC051684 TaxID=3365670 RepID=UPI00379E9070